MLQYAVLGADARLLAVKEYRSKEPLAFAEFFETIYKQDYFLKEDYAQVEVVNGSLSFSLIPTHYFAPQRMKEFAGALINDSLSSEHIAYRAMEQEKATAIFLVPTEVKKKCDFYFQNPEYFPSCLPLINMAHHLGNAHPDLLLLTLFQGQFVATGLRDGKLTICNAYDFNAPADLVYFVQLIMDLTKLQERNPAIVLHGDLDPKGSLPTSLAEFLPNIQWGREALRQRFAGVELQVPFSKYAYLTF